MAVFERSVLHFRPAVVYRTKVRPVQSSIPSEIDGPLLPVFLRTWFHCSSRKDQLVAFVNQKLEEGRWYSRFEDPDLLPDEEILGVLDLLMAIFSSQNKVPPHFCFFSRMLIGATCRYSLRSVCLLPKSSSKVPQKFKHALRLIFASIPLRASGYSRKKDASSRISPVSILDLHPTTESPLASASSLVYRREPYYRIISRTYFRIRANRHIPL